MEKIEKVASSRIANGNAPFFIARTPASQVRLPQKIIYTMTIFIIRVPFFSKRLHYCNTDFFRGTKAFIIDHLLYIDVCVKRHIDKRVLRFVTLIITNRSNFSL